jgi:hypothetical protein
MENMPNAYMDRPGAYRIRVSGRVSQRWADQMWRNARVVFEESAHTAETVIVGEAMDQAALMRMINALYNTGHVLLSIDRIELDETNSIEAKIFGNPSIKP